MHIQLDCMTIKCGQVLSLRTDLLPMEYCKELSLLRDNTSFNLSYEDIETIFKKEIKHVIY